MEKLNLFMKVMLVSYVIIEYMWIILDLKDI